MRESFCQSNSYNNTLSPFYYPINERTYIHNILQAQAPLISVEEIDEFRHLIAKAAVGEYFLIQSGDCAENFYECDEDTTYDKLDFLLQLATFFYKKTGCQVLSVGRIAGQYVKPRSNQHETYENKRIYSYFGDMINHFQTKYRTPDPWRMLLSYNCAASVYREINRWNEERGADQKTYTSHEALLLYYEQALTRVDKTTGLHYNLSTHFPWLGKRTINSLQHINYLKKIANPIGIKIGPDISIKNLIKTIEELDPDYIPGRITLIPRLGASTVRSVLPQLIEAVKKTQRAVLWSCDPMHGNTERIRSGIKIRKLSDIVDEIKSSFLIHKNMGSKLNAIHLEATYQDVHECVNYESSSCSSINDKKNYKSLFDPRLNYEQTIHVIQLIAKHYIG